MQTFIKLTQEKKDIAQKQSGFTIVELIMIMLIIAALAAIVVPKFMHLEMDTRQHATQSIAEGLNAASIANYRLYKAGSSQSHTITNCQDVKQSLPSAQGLPEEYLVISQAIAADASVICTVYHRDAPTITATFVGYGVP
jgi:type II secretory pathway pseudopilin PulG